MLIDADFKALELLSAFYLSQDPVGLKEVNDPTINLHGNNRERLGLPTELVAKVFIFRLIFGGGPDGYALDPDFNYISNSPDFWQDIITRTYEKYQGLGRWHSQLVAEAMDTGKVMIPTGRSFYFTPFSNGMWPRTQILNYPVQGFGADLMVLARVGLHSALRGLKDVLLISTVHDSILIDTPSKGVDKVVETVYTIWDQLPKLFEEKFGVPLNVIPRVKVKVGKDWGNMEVYS